MSERQLWNWITYPLRMAGYRILRRVFRSIGILR